MNAFLNFNNGFINIVVEIETAATDTNTITITVIITPTYNTTVTAADLSTDPLFKITIQGMRQTHGLPIGRLYSETPGPVRFIVFFQVSRETDTLIMFYYRRIFC